MATPITHFSGVYRFLSNFWPTTTVYVDDVQCATLEHAYQASKTLDPYERAYVQAASTPGLAKQRGKMVPKRDDWEQVKLRVMSDLLQMKFQDPALRAKLLATGDAELVEGNSWGDTFWGVCRGKGENHLGKLLMEIRRQCR